MGFLDKLAEMERRFEEIDRLSQEPAFFANPETARAKMKERAGLLKTVERYRDYKKAIAARDEAKSLVESADAEMRELAKGELPDLEKRAQETLEQLREQLVSEDEDSHKSALVEIQAGTGGDEAALFAEDLFRMYSRYAQTKGWKIELYDTSIGNAGGYKAVSFGVEGDGVYGRLRFESGVHRVQRVPETESQGRIHTSAAAVVVLPEVEDLAAIDMKKLENETRVDKFSAGGPGGQHVNKTQSACRPTHEPTNIVVQCQDERSLIKNLAKAWKSLASRVHDAMKAEREAKEGATRRSLRGRGNRNERIRTYNFPQSRVTDHRVEGLTIHDLDKVLSGELDILVEKLIAHDKEEGLKAL
ncbi:MAG: peptide chain release factor 1 [Planctomycetota bacterium]